MCRVLQTMGMPLPASFLSGISNLARRLLPPHHCPALPRPAPPPLPLLRLPRKKARAGLFASLLGQVAAILLLCRSLEEDLCSLLPPRPQPPGKPTPKDELAVVQQVVIWRSEVSLRIPAFNLPVNKGLSVQWLCSESSSALRQAALLRDHHAGAFLSLGGIWLKRASRERNFPASGLVGRKSWYLRAQGEEECLE